MNKIIVLLCFMFSCFATEARMTITDNRGLCVSNRPWEYLSIASSRRFMLYKRISHLRWEPVPIKEYSTSEDERTVIGKNDKFLNVTSKVFTAMIVEKLQKDYKIPSSDLVNLRELNFPGEERTYPLVLVSKRDDHISFYNYYYEVVKVEVGFLDNWEKNRGKEPTNTLFTLECNISSFAYVATAVD